MVGGMTYADYCSYDSVSTFYAETFPIAKKDHYCCECHKKIVPGERYLSCRGLCEGDFWHESQCLNCRDFCMEIRDRLMEGRSCLSFGERDEFLDNSLHDICVDTKKDRKKFARLRSMVAVWRWDRERTTKPFWNPKVWPHRKAQDMDDGFNLARGLIA